MADVPSARKWGGQLAFVLLTLMMALFQMLPLQTVPRGWATPDLILAVTVAWVLRRPDLVPVALIALVFFVTDLLLQRPPGLWTALVIIMTEIIRARVSDLRSSSFAFEWAAVTAALVGLFLAYRFAFLLMMLPQASLILTLTQLTATVLSYPVIVLLSYIAFGVSRPGLGEVDDMGRRL